jgi:hypothetical protein
MAFEHWTSGVKLPTLRELSIAERVCDSSVSIEVDALG